ncbi:lipopolysaccharide assembly protein LapA domain-containing protein [Pengzhenrongella frigida]|uniref:LapA family protein n=1 Tax=Pengzhenrongella frigida TaxID=1259133 RepID=A0A4Q5N0X0_9MICO|nr:LapA family protein [Cellulomonas sp. HLT2-17]RYV51676.1 LapA family protein [Cellulomonas sp. HLT2-17]
MTTTPASGSTSRVSGRAIGGLVIAAVLLVWILSNRAEVEVSFIFTTAVVPLWFVLAIAAVLGVAAGFLVGRKRYRRR